MPPLNWTLDLSKVAENALRSSADFNRFTKAIHDFLPDIATTLPTPSGDSDSVIKIVCPVFRAVHLFQANDRNGRLGLTLLSASTSFLVRILPRLAFWMTYIMDNIIIPGLASHYDEDLHRICVQCLLDAVHDRRQPDLMQSLTSIATPSQNPVKFIVNIIPDLLLHHSASISRPGSVDTLIELCDIVHTLLYVSGLDSTWKEDLVTKLADTPGPTLFSLNSVLQDGLCRLRSKHEQEQLEGAVRDLSSGYSLMNACTTHPSCNNADHFNRLEERRVLEVAWRVAHCRILHRLAFGDDTNSFPVQRLFRLACGLFLLLSANVFGAVQQLGLEVVTFVVKHGFLESALLFDHLAESVGIPRDYRDIYSENLDKIMAEVSRYLCYHSVVKETQRTRASLVTFGFDLTRPAWTNLSQRLDSAITSSLLPSICDAQECPDRQSSTTPKRCSGCRVSMYCSTQCQRIDWVSGHRNTCTSFQAYRRAIETGEVNMKGFIVPQEAAHLSQILHGLIRGYDIHQPAWVARFDARGEKYKLDYGPPPETFRKTTASQFPIDDDVLNARGIAVLVTLPTGIDRPYHCCAFLKPEWIENPSALYLPNLVRLY
ncbi:hypothetical protein BDZ89DRAFT_1170840 [Hymenopellis radicata]|nr:hypothetical protein BDZ89DRAFT_1170840 [Hymenopellis radicata]